MRIRHSVYLAIVVLAPLLPAGAQTIDFGRMRVSGQPTYRAPDGSTSEIRQSDRADPFGAIHLVPTKGGATLSFVSDNAGGCVGWHSVEHRIHRDTLTVTVFTNAPALCPGIWTPTTYVLTLKDLPPATYVLRVYQESRGGGGGEASGAAPWLSTTLFTR